MLFVDDDLDACEMLELLMHSCGIDASCAQSVDAAWPLIKGQSFDLFVLDGWLPGIDGFEFCRQIREFDSDTPILFYSGAAYDTDKQMGIAAGANAYVAKPDVEGLISTITDLVAKARTRQVDSRVVVKYSPVEIRFADGFLSGENGERTRSGVNRFRAAQGVNTVILSNEFRPA
ncbi:MAG TPA: response regulator [Pyrinomonadaceae bacterium]|nr:response regulator [Pyrinomonadaceae bacterium]